MQIKTPARLKAIKARLRDCGGIEGWKMAIERASESDFLCGRAKDWKASFDWLTKAANFTKLMEGNYAYRAGRGGNGGGMRSGTADALGGLAARRKAESAAKGPAPEAAGERAGDGGHADPVAPSMPWESPAEPKAESRKPDPWTRAALAAGAGLSWLHPESQRTHGAKEFPHLCDDQEARVKFYHEAGQRLAEEERQAA